MAYIIKYHSVCLKGVRKKDENTVRIYRPRADIRTHDLQNMEEH
jgi:hypothetical protein